MTSRLAGIVIAVVSAGTLMHAQEPHPETLAGFIKPGMHLGIRSYDNGVGYNVVVFTS